MLLPLRNTADEISRGRCPASREWQGCPRKCDASQQGWTVRSPLSLSNNNIIQRYHLFVSTQPSHNQIYLWRSLSSATAQQLPLDFTTYGIHDFCISQYKLHCSLRSQPSHLLTNNYSAWIDDGRSLGPSKYLSTSS